MSLGTLYVSELPRPFTPEYLVKKYNLDIKIIDVKEDPEFEKKFPLLKTPDFVTPDVVELSEGLAVCMYIISQIGDANIREQLLGKTPMEKIQVVRWFSLSNSDLMDSIGNQYKQIIGWKPYSAEAIKNMMSYVDVLAPYYEKRLKESKYLASDNLSLADIHAAVCWGFGFGSVCGEEWRSKHPILINWFERVVKCPILHDIIKRYPSRQEPIARDKS